MSSLSRKFARESKRGMKLMEQYQQPGTYEYMEKEYKLKQQAKKDQKQQKST